jgi:hypothetical protein
MERFYTTYTHSDTLPRWNIYVLRSTPFVLLCETVWIEILRIWEVLGVMLDT